MKPDLNNQSSQSGWTSMMRKIRRIFYFSAIILILFLGLFIYWKYFFIYSDGYRAGLLQKFSHKGNLFKTYEGELILSSITSNNNVSLASEKFYFSVFDKKLSQKLDTLQGQMVIVHYHQQNAVLFWRGETTYFVDSVRIRK